MSTAAHSIGGSLLSIGSLEKRKGLKKLAKSIGNRVKGKSKNKLDHEHEFDEVEEHQIRPTRQEPGEADPGVISEDDDEFTVCCFFFILIFHLLNFQNSFCHSSFEKYFFFNNYLYIYITILHSTVAFVI